MIKVFINDKILDLYGDEELKIISKSADIEDLGKVFNDFSMPFSVPATDNNNSIFKHYYNSNIEDGLDPNKRLDAYIEYHTFPFKIGKMQINSVAMKNDKASSYSLTFYGSPTQLKDTFGDDTLNNLDYNKAGEKVNNVLSDLDFEWTAYNWQRAMHNDSFKNGDVIVPLIISADRPLQLGSGNKFDILTANGSIKAEETRPAIRVRKILDAIQTKYQIGFSDHLFNTAHINNMYMWLNNNEEMEYSSQLVTPNPSFTGPDAENRFSYTAPYMSANIRKYSDYVINPRDGNSYATYLLQNTYVIQPSSSYNDVKYKCRIYDDNDVLLAESEDWMNGMNAIFWNYTSQKAFNASYNSIYINQKVRLEIITQSSLRFTLMSFSKYTKTTKTWEEDAPGSSINTFVYAHYVIFNKQSTRTNILVEQLYDISQNIPSMKVLDFISTLMKMYKAVIIPTSRTFFEVMPIDEYYSKGKIVDITPYVLRDNITIDIPEIYSSILFKYKKTKNFLGAQYRLMTDPNDEVGYGDLNAEFPIDVNRELKVELPLDNMLYERKSMPVPVGSTASFGTFTNIYIGQSTERSGSDFKVNKSDPILFYRNGRVDFAETPIKIAYLPEREDEEGNIIVPPSVDLTHSHLIGTTNDAVTAQVTNTLNWGSEIDPWHMLQMDQSLYLNYWKNWIQNIYDNKQRKVKIKARMPLRLQAELELSHKIIIDDVRYHINEYETNLTTGITSFTLFRDNFPTEIGAIVSPTLIEANMSSKYYGIRINTGVDKVWTATIDTPGVDWLDILTPTGTGSGEVLIYVKTRMDGTMPEGAENRLCTINIKVDGFDHKVILVQDGIL